MSSCAQSNSEKSSHPNSENQARARLMDLCIEVDSSIYLSRDSMLYYLVQTYSRRDPRSMYITGAGWFLWLRGDYPDDLMSVGEEEAVMLLRQSADMGYVPAKRLIEELEKE